MVYQLEAKYTSREKVGQILMHTKDFVLVINDMRERLVAAMQARARTIRNTKTLLARAEEIGIPVILTSFPT